MFNDDKKYLENGIASKLIQYGPYCYLNSSLKKHGGIVISAIKKILHLFLTLNPMTCVMVAPPPSDLYWQLSKTIPLAILIKLPLTYQVSCCYIIVFDHTVHIALAIFSYTLNILNLNFSLRHHSITPT